MRLKFIIHENLNGFVFQSELRQIKNSQELILGDQQFILNNTILYALLNRRLSDLISCIWGMKKFPKT
jgi:hypothetical protein